MIDISNVYANGLEQGHRPEWDRVPVDPVEVDLCRVFIKDILTPATRGQFSSYHLKHAAERYSKRYISNGAFIHAAKLENIEQHVIRAGSLNTLVCARYKSKKHFNMCNGKF